MPDKNHYAKCLFSMPDASKLCQIWHTLCQVETTGADLYAARTLSSLETLIAIGYSDLSPEMR